MQYELTEITTSDGLVHQGIYHESEKKGGYALLWIHGLTSNFYSDLTIFEKIVEKGEPAGLGFASFNNRGHDMIAGMRRVDKQSPTGFSHARGGSGEEKFEDCVHDIDAGIRFLTDKGYEKVIISGHSTGANKVCFYAGNRRDDRVGGVVLAGPISDRLIEERTNPKLETNIRRMKQMVKKGKGEYILNNLTFFPITPMRYLSLFDRHSAEDVFDYGEETPKMETFSRISVPLLIVLSGKDEYSDRPAAKIRPVFDQFAKSPKYSLVILNNATHGYEGMENQFAEAVVSWISSL